MTHYYNQGDHPGIEGDIVDEAASIDTGYAEEDIPFGRALIAGTLQGQVKLPTATGQLIIGVSKHNHMVPDSNGVIQYKQKDPVAIVEDGKIRVKCESQVSSLSDKVYVRHTAGTAGQTPGRFTAVDDLGKVDELKGCRWVTTTTGIEQIAELRINLPT